MKLRMGLWGTLFAAALAATGCVRPGNNLPPANMLMEPGPGVGGPGPGVMMPGPGGAGGMGMGGGMGCGPGGMGMGMGMDGMGMPSSQFVFLGPEGMAVAWDVGGVGMFDSEPLIAPGRQNFGQGAIYRLKLTNIPGRPGVELYPTLEVGPATPRTDAYLAHNAIPIRLTEEDLDQVQSGNFVTKVIYLPDPEFQELALAGAETLVSTRLDPGVDPIVEADRRGAILAIVRLGNKDLQAPGGGAGDAGIVPASYQTEAPGMPNPYDPYVGGGDQTQAVGGNGEGYGDGYADAGYGAAGYGAAGNCGPGDPNCAPEPGMNPYPGAVPPNALAGYPQYGMPITGTPIGLPGPPHIPLGVPAGLQKHVIKNRTHVHVPEPVKNFKISVKQHPGYHYPRPVSRVHIGEWNLHAPTVAHNPLANRHKKVVGKGKGYCPCP